MGRFDSDLRSFDSGDTAKFSQPSEGQLHKKIDQGSEQPVGPEPEEVGTIEDETRIQEVFTQKLTTPAAEEEKPTLSDKKIRPTEDAQNISSVMGARLADLKATATLVQFAINKPPIPTGLAEMTKLPEEALRELSLTGCQFAIEDGESGSLNAEEACKKFGVQKYSTLVLYNEKNQTYRLITPSISQKRGEPHEITFRPDPAMKPIENLENLWLTVCQVRKESLLSAYPLFRSHEQMKKAPDLVKLIHLTGTEYHLFIQNPNGNHPGFVFNLETNFQHSMINLAHLLEGISKEAQDEFLRLKKSGELAGVTIQAQEGYTTSVTLKDGSTQQCSNFSELETLITEHAIKQLKDVHHFQVIEQFQGADDIIKGTPYQGYIILASIPPQLAYYDSKKEMIVRAYFDEHERFLGERALGQQWQNQVNVATKKLEEFASKSQDIEVTQKLRPSSKDILIMHEAGEAALIYWDPISGKRVSVQIDLLKDDLETAVEGVRKTLGELRQERGTILQALHVEQVNEKPLLAQNKDPAVAKAYMHVDRGRSFFYMDTIDPTTGNQQLTRCDSLQQLQQKLRFFENAKLVRARLATIGISIGEDKSGMTAVRFLQEDESKFTLFGRYGRSYTREFAIRPNDNLNEKLTEFEAILRQTFEAFVEEAKRQGLQMRIQDFDPAILNTLSPDALPQVFVSPKSSNLTLVYYDMDTKEIRSTAVYAIDIAERTLGELLEKQRDRKTKEIVEFCKSSTDVVYKRPYEEYSSSDILLSRLGSKLLIEISDPYVQNVTVFKTIDLLNGDLQQAIQEARAHLERSKQKIIEAKAKLNVQVVDVFPSLPDTLEPGKCRVYLYKDTYGQEQYVVQYLDPVGKRVGQYPANSLKEASEGVDFIMACTRIVQAIPEARLLNRYSDEGVGKVTILRDSSGNGLSLRTTYDLESVEIAIDPEKDDIDRKIGEFCAKKEIAQKKFAEEEKRLDVFVINADFDEGLLGSEPFTLDTPPQIFRDDEGKYIVASYDIKLGTVKIENLFTLTSVKEFVENWTSQKQFREFLKEHPELTFNPLELATQSKLFIEPLTITTSLGSKTVYELKGFIPNTTEILSVRFDSLTLIETATKELTQALSLGKQLRLSSEKALSTVSHFTDDVEIPPITKELQENPLASLFILEAVFESIQWGKDRGSRDPTKLYNDGGRSTVEDYERGLEKYVAYVTERRHMGAFSVEEHEAVYDELEARTRTLILDFTTKLIGSDQEALTRLLESLQAASGDVENQKEIFKELIRTHSNKSELIDTFQSHVLWLCEAGLHCENRWKGDVANIFRLARTGTLAGGEAKESDLNVPEFLHHQIDQLKIGAVDEMLTETVAVKSDYDTSHGTYNMQNAVVRRGVKLPGVASVEKRDLYFEVGESKLYRTDREIFDGFMSKCGAYNATKIVHGALNEQMGKKTQFSILSAFREMAEASLLDQYPDAKKYIESLKAKYAQETAAIEAAMKNEQPLSAKERELLETLKALDLTRNKLIEDDLPDDEVQDEIKQVISQIEHLKIIENKSAQLDPYKELLSDWHMDVVSYQDKRTACANRIFPQIAAELDKVLQNQGYLIIEDDPITDTPKYEITQDGTVALLKSYGFIVPREGVSSVASSQMQDYNSRLQALQLESHRLEIMLARAEANNEDEVAKSISNRKIEIVDQHEALELERIDFVKTAFPDNPVFALAMPRAIGANTTFYTASSESKLQSIITKGIVFNENDPATLYHPEFRSKPTDKWEGLEMGQRGLYFSRDDLPYLSELSGSPFALRMHSVSEIVGVSIPPVAELKSAGFTEEQIEQGYAKIQKDYAFLQHEGLPPKDTEVVFTRANGTLIPNAIVQERNGQEYVISVSDYLSSENLMLHPTWSPK